MGEISLLFYDAPGTDCGHKRIKQLIHPPELIVLSGDTPASLINRTQ